MNTLQDIIDLKRETGVVEKNATQEKMEEWYKYALKEGIIETEYDEGKLLGFAEWVRLSRIPDINKLQKSVDFNSIHSAPILFVMNMCTRAPVFWKLRKKILDKNKDRECLCWHSKKRNKMRVFRRCVNVF